MSVFPVRMPSLDDRREKVMTFSGPVVATATPFDITGQLDISQVPAYLKYLIKIGAKGVYVHGTTGEGVSLSNDEKKSLTQAWVDAIKVSKSNLLCVINVSATCIEETKDHVQFCSRLAVDALAVLPPFYYRPSQIEQLVAYLQDVSSFGPDLPLLYYHFPAITHVTYPLTELLPAVIDAVPAFVGLKFTSKDIVELSRIQFAFKDKLKIFVGYEEALLAAFAVGLDSAVCALFNFEEVIRRYYEIRGHHAANPETARAALAAITLFNKNFPEGSFIAKVKLELNEIAGDAFSVGSPRPPIYP